ncbi:uncharacterized protein VTP21DRAFT_7752 [Calcarisporiella thermophila]|uniref:uncharacterized protein n=1 Tax=Calcarisporiella thermophila TaxID=911321 RepID=UPI00374205D7
MARGPLSGRAVFIKDAELWLDRSVTTGFSGNQVVSRCSVDSKSKRCGKELSLNFRVDAKFSHPFTGSAAQACGDGGPPLPRALPALRHAP